VKRRLARIQRIIDLRQRALDEQLVLLSRAITTEQAAALAEQECRNALRTAELERYALSSRVATAGALMQSIEWLDTVAVKHHLAARELHRSRVETQRSRLRVKQAQLSLKQVQLLFERIEQRQQLLERRAERRREDELAQVLAGLKKDH
jgi:flagellar biosynthesis chaperone FliJ